MNNYLVLIALGIVLYCPPPCRVLPDVVPCASCCPTGNGCCSVWVCVMEVVAVCVVVLAAVILGVVVVVADLVVVVQEYGRSC